jgi:hypothetical protein
VALSSDKGFEPSVSTSAFKITEPGPFDSEAMEFEVDSFDLRSVEAGIILSVGQP